MAPHNRRRRVYLSSCIRNFAVDLAPKSRAFVNRIFLLLAALLPALPFLLSRSRAADPAKTPPAVAGGTAASVECVVGKAPFADPKIFFAADGTPDYRAFYRERYEYMADHFFAPADDVAIKRLKHSQLGDVVTAMLWLSQSGGGNKYLDRGHDLFGILIGYTDGNPAVSHDCFGFYPVLKSAIMLKAAGRFDAEWEPALRGFTLDGLEQLNKHWPTSDGNQDLARLYACLLARRLYPDMPEAASAASKVNEAFTRFIHDGDLYTDSRNYFEVSLVFFIQIARDLGREDEIARSPTFERMFANFRDAISPNGFLPEFGAGYFSPNRYACTPIFLEYAAALYHEPTFSAAARRYFNLLIQSGPARDTNISSAIHSCVHVMPQLLDDFPIRRGPAPQAEFVSGVTRRIARIGGERPGFLILRPSLVPAAPMILMDLLGQGDHCQPEFVASIGYYESNHVPLFYQYGRYISGASRANQIFLGQSGASEPDPVWPADTWRTVSIPADRLTEADGSARIDAVSLRTDDRKKSVDRGFVLDNLRLSGPGGTKSVCDLSQGSWRGNSHSVTAGKQPGARAIRVLADGNGCTLKSFSPLKFDPQKYVELLCDVKWFGGPPDGLSGRGRPSAQLRPTTDSRSWMPVEETSLLALLKNVRTERHGDDCWARLEYSSYGTFDSGLIRQIVLTREGVLAVRDDIRPGASADGRPAFSLWQMYSIDSEGPNRFSTRGECAYPSCVLGDTRHYRRGMSAYFSGPMGTRVGKQIVPRARLGMYREIQRDLDLRTAYARLAMRAGQAAYLNLLVVPHPPDADLAKLDAATSTNHDAARSTFQTMCDGVAVTIEIARSGEWQVRR